MTDARAGDVRLQEMLQGPRCHRRRFVLQSEESERAREEVLCCPICGGAASELKQPQRETEAAVIEAAQEAFPGWQPEEGLCDICAQRHGGRERPPKSE